MYLYNRFSFLIGILSDTHNYILFKIIDFKNLLIKSAICTFVCYFKYMLLIWSCSKIYSSYLGGHLSIKAYSNVEYI